MAASVLEAFTTVIASLGTLWVHVGTPNLTETEGGSAISAGDSAANSADITTVLGYATWISLAVAVISLFALGALVATRLRAGEGIATVGRLGMVLAAVVLISGASALVAGVMPTGPDEAGGAVLFLQSGLWWYMGAAAIASVIIGGARMAWEQRAEHGRETVKGLLTLAVVASAGVTVVGLLVAASDSFAVWLLNGSLQCDVTASSACFGDNMVALLALTAAPAGSALGPLLIIILGLVAVLAAAFQIMLMVARGGMLVILAGILPLSASFTNTEMGKSWFRKCIAWLVAFILYKPAAAIVYAAAFQLVGTSTGARRPGTFGDDGTGLLSVLTGLMLMVIALFALPALMRFVTPAVGAMAGAAGGGAMAAGALAALPTGAASLGRMASGSASSGTAAGSGTSGAPGSHGHSASSGPSGSQSSGGTGSVSSSQAGGSGGGAATQGAAAAGGGGAASGGGAAASGAAAS
ncbi:hypothetical protein, partial [Actinotalea sp. C106]|uniref:hypothetical protein n=1 Tax=Actinotalea sp. C106 TaxID=2908644 RepID=UPI0020278AE2